MEKYYVGVKEVYEQMWEVMADSKDEAIEKLESYMADSSNEDEVSIVEGEMAYCNSLDSTEWSVYTSNRLE